VLMHALLTKMNKLLKQATALYASVEEVRMCAPLSKAPADCPR